MTSEAELRADLGRFHACLTAKNDQLTQVWRADAKLRYRTGASDAWLGAKERELDHVHSESQQTGQSWLVRKHELMNAMTRWSPHQEELRAMRVEFMVCDCATIFRRE